MGQAALRDQKIGNALRTIDTWYEGFAEHGKPIPVEPQGANLDAQRFFRSKDQSSFSIMKRINGVDPNANDGMFLIASLMRGGVYSESEKKAKEDKKSAASEGKSDEV